MAALTLAIGGFLAITPVTVVPASASVNDPSQTVARFLTRHSVVRALTADTLGHVARPPAAPVGFSAGWMAFNSATQTLYVTNSGNAAPDDRVSVIDTRHCHAGDTSGCSRTWPTVTVGQLPVNAALDPSTDTVYTTNIGDNTVSVIDGSTCNGRRTGGCSQHPPAVQVGAGPVAAGLDAAHHTLYVTNLFDNTVSMIDTNACSAINLSGCSTLHPPVVAVGGGPDDVDVDQATHTVYVANGGQNNDGTTVTVFDTDTCNASTQAGCAAPGTATVGTAPFGVRVDVSTNTIYTANFVGDPGTRIATVSVNDGRSCDAADLAGCASQGAGTVRIGRFTGPFFLAVDASAETVFVSLTGQDLVAAIDTDRCNGSHLAACAGLRPPQEQTGEGPLGLALDAATHTLYAANGVDNDVSVLDASRCNGDVFTACRTPAPTVRVGSGPFAVGVDQAFHTAYVADDGNTGVGRTVSMIDTNTCNGDHTTCATAVPTLTVGDNPGSVAVDEATHTVYVANAGEPSNGVPGSVSVIDASTCNAFDLSGCHSLGTLPIVTGIALAVAVNSATDTVYVASLRPQANTIVFVFDGSRCNAAFLKGCNQKGARAPVGGGVGAQALAINEATDTIYVANTNDNDVSVIDGATCRAGATSGCASAHPTVGVGLGPIAVAVDESSDTVYVANNANGDAPGSLSVIDGSSCNGSNITGCGQTPPLVATGRAPFGVVLNPGSKSLYVADVNDANITVIAGAHCNATDQSGCAQSPRLIPVGLVPVAVTFDPAHSTVYVANFADDTVSVLDAG